MFKELKVLKLLVFLSALFLLFLGNNVNNHGQILFFSSENAYSSEEAISISFLTERRGISYSDIVIKDIEGTIKLEKTIEDIKSPTDLPQSIIAEGYSSPKSEFSLELDPGFYSVNDVHPLIVKNEKQESQITVVIPLMNILMYQYIKGDKAVYGKNAVISTLQNVIMDENLKDARTHFKLWEENYSVNYITDYDLESFEDEPQPQLLVFAGNVPFWTCKMKDQFEFYLESGGNVLLMSSYFQDNYAEFNAEKHQVRIRDPNLSSGYSSFGKEPNELSSIISYAQGGIPTTVSFVDKDEKLVNDVFIQSDLEIGVRDSVSILTISSGKTYPIDINWLISRKAKRVQKENTSGVVEISLPNSQKIISLGSCDWLRSYNQNEQSDAAGKMLEIMDYVLK